MSKVAAQRRTVLSLLAGIGLAVALGATTPAQADGNFVVLPQRMPTDNPLKVEITEFFSYGCPHCDELEPHFAAWVKRQGKDVVIRRVPISFDRDEWKALSRLYLTLDAMQQSERLTPAIFKAIHKDKRKLYSEGAQTTWLAGQGVDMQKFKATYNSFIVMSGVSRSDQLGAAHRIQGVPSVSVDGKYLTSVSMAGGFDNFFVTLDQLVARARVEKGRK